MSRRRSQRRPRGRHDRPSPAQVGADSRARPWRVRRGSAAVTVDLTDPTAAAVGAERNRRRRRIHSDATMHPLLNGAIAALTVAALSFVVVLGVTVIGWVLAADHSSLGAMFQVAILGWLTVHLVPVSTVGGWLWLPPLVLTVGVGWLARRVGQTTLRRGSVTDAAARWRVFGAAAVTYAALATVLAWAATGPAARVPLWLVPFATAAVFAVGFAPVIARTSQRRADLRRADT